MIFYDKICPLRKCQKNHKNGKMCQCNYSKGQYRVVRYCVYTKKYCSKSESVYEQIGSS